MTDKIKEQIQGQIKLREEEIAHYQFNINCYQVVVDNIPAYLPPHLAGKTVDEAIKLGLPMGEIAQIHDWHFRQGRIQAIIAEKLAQRTPILIKQALEKML